MIFQVSTELEETIKRKMHCSIPRTCYKQPSPHYYILLPLLLRVSPDLGDQFFSLAQERMGVRRAPSPKVYLL